MFSLFPGLFNKNYYFQKNSTQVATVVFFLSVSIFGFRLAIFLINGAMAVS